MSNELLGFTSCTCCVTSQYYFSSAFKDNFRFVFSIVAQQGHSRIGDNTALLKRFCANKRMNFGEVILARIVFIVEKFYHLTLPRTGEKCANQKDLSSLIPLLYLWFLN